VCTWIYTYLVSQRRVLSPLRPFVVHRSEAALIFICNCWRHGEWLIGTIIAQHSRGRTNSITADRCSRNSGPHKTTCFTRIDFPIANFLTESLNELC
jgi:hypothetical protein